MNPFSLALSLGIIGPALAVGAFAYAWRRSLQHIWWFTGIGGITSYILMAMCLTWALSDIGLTGNVPVTPKPTLDPVAIRYLSFMLVWLIGTFVALFITRHLLSKV